MVGLKVVRIEAKRKASRNPLDGCRKASSVVEFKGGDILCSAKRDADVLGQHDHVGLAFLNGTYAPGHPVRALCCGRHQVEGGQTARRR